MTIRSLGIATVFLVGCAVGGASSQLIVPKASAQQAATLTKYEHFCLQGDWEKFQEAAAKAGDAGWELASYTHQSNVMSHISTSACFKRPKM